MATKDRGWCLEVLGLGPESSPSVINSRYHELFLFWHVQTISNNDLNKLSAASIARLEAAYKELSKVEPEKPKAEVPPPSGLGQTTSTAFQEQASSTMPGGTGIGASTAGTQGSSTGTIGGSSGGAATQPANWIGPIAALTLLLFGIWAVYGYIHGEEIKHKEDEQAQLEKQKEEAAKITAAQAAVEASAKAQQAAEEQKKRDAAAAFQKAMQDAINKMPPTAVSRFVRDEVRSRVVQWKTINGAQANHYQVFGYDQRGNIVNLIDYEAFAGGTQLYVQYVVNYDAMRDEVSVLRYQPGSSSGQYPKPSGADGVVYVGGTNYYYFERGNRQYLFNCENIDVDGQLQHWLQINRDPESRTTSVRYHRGRWDGSSEEQNLEAIRPYLFQWFDMWQEFGANKVE